MFEEAQDGSSDMYSADTVPQVHERHSSGSSPSNEPAASKPAQQTACAQAGSKPTDSIDDSVGSQEGAPKASAGEIKLQFGSFGRKDEEDDQGTGEAILTGTEPSEDTTTPADG
jgi:hypothetical protein